ncbi:MAG TPA: SOS response-associated peptidase [Thermoanaerobaculia bacterium]|nr:SOS response-associated peptidase [Thermoanaerobaculia bacterium]
MCGRYTLSTPGDVVADLFALEAASPLPRRYNIAPTQESAVVRRGDEGARRLSPLRWGLIPSWAKDPAIGNRLINARAETAAEKPAFRDGFRHRRCLVVADGFYEWKKTPGGKQPFWFRRQSGEPFAFAGLWERWRSREHPDTEPVETFTILTTSANATVEPVHARMPVLLSAEEDFAAWLDPATDRNDLEQLLAPAAPDLLAAVPVSRWVNDPSHDDPRCVEAVGGA